jgi:hydrogenase nickel incorporation protein HypA/HybF
MHELGIVINIVKQMEDYMLENNLTKIEKIVLQVGKLSEIYPRFLLDVFPIAVENTKLAQTQLIIEETIGIGQCKECDFAFDLIENNNECPICGSKQFSIISGREFLIKELHAY